MLIRLGYDIRFNIPAPVGMVAMLHVHPSRRSDLLEPDDLRLNPNIPAELYTDSFGNLCTRFEAPAGLLMLSGDTLIRDSGQPDAVDLQARQHRITELPHEVMIYLLSSRYCEVDRLSSMALDLFGDIPPGWGRVEAICDWVHSRVEFGYHHARSTKTALDVFTERQGVCRDFQHLAITLCRAMNIPARYATGYLGDIGVPPSDTAMDFSAWFEVYLGGRWWTSDARHNRRRIGRVLIAVGQDATDVALTTSFGTASLKHFTVVSDEVAE